MSVSAPRPCSAMTWFPCVRRLTYDYSVFSDKVNLQQAAIDNINWAVRSAADLIVVNVGLWWPCAPAIVHA